MKFPTTQKLIDIANLINAKHIGADDFPVKVSMKYTWWKKEISFC